MTVRLRAVKAENELWKCCGWERAKVVPADGYECDFSAHYHALPTKVNSACMQFHNHNKGSIWTKRYTMPYTQYSCKYLPIYLPVKQLSLGGVCGSRVK